MTVLLPTHRAVRALQDAFLRAAKGRALLLPRLIPISETDEDQGLLADLAGGASPLGAEFTLPPAIGKLERQLALTRLVLAWSRRMTIPQSGPDGELAPDISTGAATPAQAAHLAADLARLMDMVETEDRSLDGLAGLGKSQFHHGLVSFARTDDAIMLEDRHAAPFPGLDHFGVGLMDSFRILASVAPRQSPSSAIRASISAEASSVSFFTIIPSLPTPQKTLCHPSPSCHPRTCCGDPFCRHCGAGHSHDGLPGRARQ